MTRQILIVRRWSARSFGRIAESFVRSTSRALCAGSLVVLFLAGNGEAEGPSVWNHPGLGVESIYPTAERCGTVAAGDFDQDGDTDLAVAEDDSTAISLWWNDGKAQFDGRGAALVGHPYSTFVPIDVNGDGTLDLAVADTMPGGGVEILRGLGGGSFAAAAPIAPGLRCAVLITAELNGDGRPDLVAATSGAPFRLVVLLQGDQGAFVPAGEFATSDAVGALTSGDFDADGSTDIAVGVASGSLFTIDVLRGDGAGGVGEWGVISYPMSLGASALIPRDLNGDGRLDLLSGSGSVNSSDPYSKAFVHLNLGGGSFSSTELLSNGFCGGLATTDVDGNGRAEVLALRVNGGSAGSDWAGTDLYIFENAWDPLVRNQRLFCLDYGRYSLDRMITADLDQDGRADLVISHEEVSLPFLPSRSGRVSVVRSRSDGQPLLPVQSVALPGTIRASRFTHNGPSELISAGSSGTYRVAFDRHGIASPPHRISDATRAWVLDADGDGRDDLALGFGGDSIGIALTGNDGESLPVSSWVVGRWLATGDLDGDRRSEIALARPTPNGPNEVVIAWPDPHGRFGRVTATGLLQYTNGRYATAIDDAMGGSAGELIQITAYRSSEGLGPDTAVVVRVLPNGRTRVLSHSLLARAGLPRAPEVIAADVDGDGRKELILLRGPVSDTGTLCVLKRQADGGFAYDKFYPFGWFPQNLSLTDLDGDGDLDALCVDDDEGGLERKRLWIRWNDGAGGFDESWNRHLGNLYNSYGPTAAVGDLDGDDIPDVAVGIATGNMRPIRVVFGDRGSSSRTVQRASRAPVDVVGSRASIRADVASGNPLALTATVELSAAGEAALDLYDLAGRRVTSHRIAADAAGVRSITMTLPHALPRGIYWLSLRQGTARATTRVAVVR
jgi:hypothetical protein